MAPAPRPLGSRSRLSVIGWAAFLGIVALIPITIGVESALHFSSNAIDGPFQLYNALRRIAAGQRGGVDFQFFHGIGVPYLHYLPFRMMGGSFAASELTRQLVTALAYPFVLVVFFRTFTRDWGRTFALSAIVLVLSLAMRLQTVLVAINSVLGFRSTVATLVPVIWCMPVRPRLRSVFTGVALGGAILCGTEQGLAVLAGFVIVNAIMIWRSPRRRSQLNDAAMTLGTMILTIVVLMMSIGGIAGLKGALFYNLKLVPMDQYWYFGVSPNLFLRSWHGVWPILAEQPAIPETILLAALFVGLLVQRTWREPTGEIGRRHAALAMLALYGLISCASLLGIVLVGYIQPCIRALLLIGALEFDGILQSRVSKSGRWAAWTPNKVLVGTAALSVGALVFAFPFMIRTLLVTMPHVVSDHIVHREGLRLEAMWPETLAEGQTVVNAHRGPNGEPPTIWSTYSGLLEARTEVFSPSSFDYIIHALGPHNRERYVERFRTSRPVLVQTVLPTFSDYELWIEQTSWDFYAELLKNYRVAGGTPWSIIWERLPAPGAPPLLYWSKHLDPGSTRIEVPTPAPGSNQRNAVLLQVELEYRVRNPLAVLPVIGALPRYLVTASGAIGDAPVTLDPYTTTTRFPLLAMEGSRLRLDIETSSLLPGARLDVQTIRVSTVPVTPGAAPWFVNLRRAVSPRRAARR